VIVTIPISSISLLFQVSLYLYTKQIFPRLRFGFSEAVIKLMPSLRTLRTFNECRCCAAGRYYGNASYKQQFLATRLNIAIDTEKQQEQQQQQCSIVISININC